jgi:hypothetical protein
VRKSPGFPHCVQPMGGKSRMVVQWCQNPEKVDFESTEGDAWEM